MNLNIRAIFNKPDRFPPTFGIPYALWDCSNASEKMALETRPPFFLYNQELLQISEARNV